MSLSTFAMLEPLKRHPHTHPQMPSTPQRRPNQRLLNTPKTYSPHSTPLHHHTLILPPLIPIQHTRKLSRQRQFVVRGQNTLNVRRSDLFVDGSNAGDSARARNTSHHYEAQHGERANRDELRELASEASVTTQFKARQGDLLTSTTYAHTRHPSTSASLRHRLPSSCPWSRDRAEAGRSACGTQPAISTSGSGGAGSCCG